MTRRWEWNEISEESIRFYISGFVKRFRDEVNSTRFRECVLEDYAESQSGPNLNTGAEILQTIWDRHQA